MACDVALTQTARQTVHREAAGRFAAAIKNIGKTNLFGNINKLN
jgi:hypothetical protein